MAKARRKGEIKDEGVGEREVEGDWWRIAKGCIQEKVSEGGK
jgi:hypothetical protein